MDSPAINMPRPTVSVALCTYNGTAFVKAQLESILLQTRLPDEIVISDDASSDDTVTVVREALASCETVRVIVLRNDKALGVTANFAQALRACTGDLIALCDQDDLWAPTKLERLTDEFARRPHLVLVHTDARIVDAAGESMGSTLLETLSVTVDEKRSVHTGDALRVLLRRNIVTGATAMMRRELLESAGSFPSSWVHDEWLAVVAAATGEMDVVEEQLIDYRQHGGNEIGVATLSLRGRIERLTRPRADRNARLLARAQSLAVRLREPGFAANTSVARLTDQKLEHERARSALPTRRVSRMWPAWVEWRTGRYHQYGLGLQDLVRDLVQPE
ncbi:glycosyltransferase family 2 protein [Cryobacterium sp. PH29-G1]|uniref:glycosyltransferase family 2 protein n=1 Tax=Cryobacterium sp. PH29-G1 TaxID=3046211 RepID=UPI0024BACCEE|nr:glycosyltransferase family 2 protein [Cryobacterium sp. PH29-G1]MDJ0350965.1 glycosyltransferase family 2 protein [Cryobacterium sp. PH29-G1]